MYFVEFLRIQIDRISNNEFRLCNKDRDDFYDVENETVNITRIILG